MRIFILSLFFISIVACNANDQQAKDQSSVDSLAKSLPLKDTIQPKPEQEKDMANNTTKEQKCVIDFYTYYVSKSLDTALNYNFTTDNNLKKYISKRKLDEIKKQYANEGGIDADPFLQAQDLFPEWKNISIKETKKIDDTHSEIKLILGAGQNMWKLKVVVINEKGICLIDQVSKD